MNHAFTIIPLTIEARGEVISSNIDEFRELVREALRDINRDLKTDEQFGQAELDAKALKDAEDAVKASKDKALADAESLHALFTAMDETSEEIRKARLDLETQIKKRKEEVKTELIEESLACFDIDPGLASRTYLPSLQAAIKGKRTLESMKTALRVTQTTAQATILKSRQIIERFANAHGAEMVSDQRELELKSPDSVEAELRRRFEAKKAAEEKKRLEAEASAAKAEADQAKLQLAEAGKPPAHPVPSNVEHGPWKDSGASNSGSTATAVVEAPAVSQAVNAAEEWKSFKASCLAAFAPLKVARDGLVHSTNIAKAQGFANMINQAWKEWA